jgi:hypothetical protein
MIYQVELPKTSHYKYVDGLERALMLVLSKMIAGKNKSMTVEKITLDSQTPEVWMVTTGDEVAYVSELVVL